MRVLAALPHYPPRSRVGAWLATHELLKYLAARGSVVHVATELGMSGAYQYEGVTVHGREMPGFMFGDVVVSHLGRNTVGLELAEKYGVPHVVMVHGLHDLNALLLHRIRPTLTVFNSESLRDATDYDGPSVVLHPAVWPDQFRTTPGDAVTLVSLTAAKGADTFYQLAEAMPDVKFLGVEGGYGDQILRRDLANVDVVPTTQDMREVYSRTRILICPSIAETYGLVGVEAMCSGIPVIAHPTPGLRESLDLAGTFVHRDDVASWITALRVLLAEDTWQAASARASARVAQLDPAADLARVSDLIESLTGDGHG